MNAQDKAVWKQYCHKLIELGIEVGAPVHHNETWCGRIEFDAMYGTTPVTVELEKNPRRGHLPQCTVLDGNRRLFELCARAAYREAYGVVSTVYVVDVTTYLLK